MGEGRDEMEQLGGSVSPELDRVRRDELSPGLSLVAADAQRRLAPCADYELQRMVTDATIALAVRGARTPWDVLKAAAAALEGRWTEEKWEGEIKPAVEAAIRPDAA